MGAVFTGDYRRLPFRTFRQQAGAVAAFYALFVAVVVSIKELTFFSLYHVLVNAAKTTSVVMFLVAAAVSALADYDRGITHGGVRFAAAAGQSSPRLLFIVIMISIMRVVGMVMDNANGVNLHPYYCH